MDVKKLMSEGGLDNISEDLFKSVSSYSDEVKAFQRQKAAEYADQVVAALKKIEQDIKDRYDRVGLNLEKRVLNIKDGKDGINGRDGRDGKDGKAGAAGLPGRDGKDGKNGRDGVDGKDGVSVVNAFLDFDNSLVIELSNGKQVNAGAILGADFAEKVKIIANGGGTSQGVIDTLASLQAQIDAISSIGFVEYQGTWNASTNTPTITASVGTKGYYYVVSVAGTTSINGESKWGVGDWIVFNGSTWQKVDGGSTGNLTTLDVSSYASIGGALTLSAYSGNTIPYLNGSSVINAGSALSFDGTNLGIGLASPSRQLTVYGSSPYIALQNSTTGATSGDGLQIQMAGGEAYIWNYENNFLSFGTNTTERMRIAGNGDISLNGGTANGVAYLNGSKVVTTGSGLVFDGTNLGLGVTPSAWATNFGIKAFDISNGCVYGATNDVNVVYNAYFNGTNFIYKTTAATARYTQSGASHAWYNAASGTAGNAITFTQAMTLNASGNLSVGTTSTDARASVWTTDNTAYASTSAGNLLQLRNSSTTSGVYAGINFVAVGNGSNVGTANINAVHTGDGSAALAFSTRNSSTTAERARIDSSGNLLVGKTAISDITVGFQVEPTGRVLTTSAASTSAENTYIVYSTGASAYRFYVGLNGTINATSTTISAISDIRYKENVRDLDVGLDKIMALKPRLYDWKEGKGANIKNARGFIAQEFEQVFPDLVDEWLDPAPEGEEPYKSVRQDLIPVLVKAIQELKAEVDSLKAQLNK